MGINDIDDRLFVIPIFKTEEINVGITIKFQ